MPFFIPKYLVGRGIEIEDPLGLATFSALGCTPDQKAYANEEDYDCRRNANEIE
jgi:hypothetical protein